MIRTTALLGLVLLAFIFFCTPTPKAASTRRVPATSLEAAACCPPCLPPPVAASPAPARQRPDDEIDRILESTSSPELVARLHSDPPDAVALAAIIALGRAGDPAALPALQAEVIPSRPFRAAQALQSIHSIERGDLAARLADGLLRSPELANADPVYHAAAVVKGVRIDDVVAELADAGSGTVRDQAVAWMEQRRQFMNIQPCGKEHP